jgi:DNA-binding XRE family transcriptional regulator
MGPMTKIRNELRLSMGDFAKLLDLALITLIKVEQGISRIPLKACPPITRLGLNFFQLTIEQEEYIRTRHGGRGF